ncbi:rCG28165 [Rattus norvegicus]|uniref:RCG28165 n=1 Tax=Rattus norvegicus TaxID=10116 RepID=A6IDR8_RAT|nr:rCG28165 [Rattus norvegicus]
MRSRRSLLTSRTWLFLKITRPSSEGWRVHLHSLPDYLSYPPFKINQDCRLLKS